eukprot:Gb_01160 [translate_table: standard]
MAKGTGFSRIMVHDVVKLEDESPIDEIKRLRNLNIFQYEEMMWLRIKNKSLMEKMDQIGSIVKNDRKARQRVKNKLQGRSLWKCLNTPLAGGVPKREIEVITQEGVLIKMDPVNDVRVFQEDGAGGWLQCEPQST